MSAENPRKKILKSGKVSWEARYRDPSGKQRSKSFPLKKEAVAFLEDRRREMRRGEWISPEDQATTLHDLATQWHSEAVKPNTVDNRKALLDNLGDFGDIPIGQIRPVDITEWNALLRKGRPWAEGRPLAASTVAVMTGQVSGLLKRAHQDKLLNRVPRFPVPRAPRKKAISRQDLATPTEIRLLMDTAMEGRRNPHGPPTPARPWLARMIWVAVGTGARVSELCALQPRDLHETTLDLDIVRQVTPGGQATAVLKTEVPRTIPVPREVVEVLLEQMEESEPGNRQPIFAHPSKPFHDRNSAGRALARVVNILGMRNLTFHDFRHFYASVLIANGAPVNEVQQALGHANASTTLDSYTHLWPRRDSLTRGMAAAALGMVRDSCGISEGEGGGQEGDETAPGLLRAVD